MSYLNLHDNLIYVAMDKDIGMEGVIFTPIPKQPNMAYCRKIIYEIYDYYELSDYIEKLIWDTAHQLFPILTISVEISMEELEKLRDVEDELKQILQIYWFNNDDSISL